MNATTNTIAAGTIVRAPRHHRGQVIGTGRAVVLGLWNPEDASAGYLVHFYGQDAPAGQVVVAFAREMTAVDAIDAMSERTLRNLSKRLRSAGQAAYTIGLRIDSLANTKRHERLGR
jgi:hypothetical protein